MPADPLLSLGRIQGSFKLTLKPLSTLKNDIQSPSPLGSPGSSLWHTNNECSCPENCSVITMYSFYSIFTFVDHTNILPLSLCAAVISCKKTKYKHSFIVYTGTQFVQEYSGFMMPVVCMCECLLLLCCLL